MKEKRLFPKLTLLTLFLALAPTALATRIWYVDGVHGNDQNNCRTPVTACRTIGHAISLASPGDSIFVAAAIYRENNLSVYSLTIVGAGAQTTIIDGGGTNRVMSTSGQVNLVGLTIRNGGGVSFLHHSFGGGIYNLGTLSINNSTISGNQADYGAGICNRQYGIITINNSTISGNGPGLDFSLGAGIANLDAARTIVNNSTISGNRATTGSGLGGGIYGSTTISNSTIAGNSAISGGGVYIYAGEATLQNSIVANNSGGGCQGNVSSHGYNLSSDNSCNFHDSGDRNNTDPLLGPLQYNGGPTQTMALQSGSPAIDAGNPSGCKDSNGHPLTTDQRGMPRPDHEDTGGCDMGAYERQTD